MSAAERVLEVRALMEIAALMQTYGHTEVALHYLDRVGTHLPAAGFALRAEALAQAGRFDEAEAELMGPCRAVSRRMAFWCLGRILAWGFGAFARTVDLYQEERQRRRDEEAARQAGHEEGVEGEAPLAVNDLGLVTHFSFACIMAGRGDVYPEAVEGMADSLYHDELWAFRRGSFGASETIPTLKSVWWKRLVTGPFRGQ